MSDTNEDLELPPSLRLLKGLVTVLMVVMIFGVITIVGLLVTRLQDRGAPLEVPAVLAMPEGAVPFAVTRGPDFWVVVTQGRRILVFDAAGALQQDLTPQ